MLAGRRSQPLWIALSLWAALAVVVVARAEPVAVSPPVTVRVTVLAEPRSETVTGDLVEYDESGLTLAIKGERRRLPYASLTAHSAFTARLRAVNPDDGRGWLDLAAFGRAVGAEREAEQAIQRALKLDPGLTADADRVRALPLNTLRGPLQPKPGDRGAGEARDPGELLTDASGEAPKFEPVTPEQAAAAMAAADREAEFSLRQLGVTARRLETDHFVIYTDWGPVDDEFLAESLEGAYRLVSREFNIPVEQNVFVGKLPVYMFDSHTTFLRYAKEVDGNQNFRVTVAGYYRGRTDGMGKLVMSKPSTTQNDGLAVARRKWARTLTHEFAHAFLARYRSNTFVPRWLNEGLAEVISEQVYPRDGAVDTARQIARTNRTISAIFDDRVMPGPEMYPVMMTLVQALHRDDPAKFVAFVDRLKAGDDAERTLREMYGVDYAGLEAAWRRHMMRN